MLKQKCIKVTITNESYLMGVISELRVNSYSPKNPDEGLAINLTTYPGLNCLEQDDPVLVKAIRDDILYPPSKTGDERSAIHQTEGLHS